MLRRTLIALGVVALLAVAAAWIAFNYLDVAVKWALEHYGPIVAGVPVKVGEVQISPRNGRGAVRALEIGNPPGFGAARAARFGEIRVALDPATITQAVIVIHELAVDDATIVYERSDKTTNLESIQRSIESYVKRADAESEAAARDDPAAPKGAKPREDKRRFVVDRLTLRGIKVTMTNPALKGQGVTFDLPDIDLRDVGKRKGGLTASELASVVTNALVQRIGQKVITNIDLLRKGGVEGAIDAIKGLFR